MQFSPRHFAEKAFSQPGQQIIWELFLWLLLLACSIAVTLGLGLTFLRSVAGMLVAIIMPGFLVLRILWPEDEASGPDRLWRLSMIVPTGIAVLGLVLLSMHYLSTYSLEKVVWTLGVVNAMFIALVYVRARRPILNVSIGDWAHGKTLSTAPRRVQVLFALSLIIFAFSVVYAMVTPPRSFPLTEFYIRTEDGELPTAMTVSQLATEGISVRVVNHEGEQVHYRIAVVQNGNGVSKQRWSEDIELLDQESFERTIELPIEDRAAEEIEFVLYRVEQGREEAYRELSLLVHNP